jgi:hypothetical protein
MRNKHNKQRRSSMDWEALLEKPSFVAQTANGTAAPFGPGDNQQPDAFTLDELAASAIAPPPAGLRVHGRAVPLGPWAGARSNRTGE